MMPMYAGSTVFQSKYRLVAYIMRRMTFLCKAEEEYRYENANVQHCSHSNLLQAG